MVTPFPAFFFRISRPPPLPKTALRSQTLSVPVVFCTKAEAEKLPFTPLSWAAE